MTDVIKGSNINTRNEKLVSTKELANILNVDKTTIQKTVQKLADVLPPVLRNSQGGYLFNEEQATLIKQEIQGHHNLQSRQIDNISTELEENEIIMKSIIILQDRNKKLKTEVTRLNDLIEKKDRLLIEQKPKVDLLEKISGTNNVYTMQQLVNLLQLPYGRNTLLKVLKDKGYLNSFGVPYQQYRKYFQLKTKHIDGANKNVSYTVVTNEGLQYLNKILKSDN